MLIGALSHQEFKPSAELVNAVMIITAIGMGTDTLDKFTKKAPADKPIEEPKPEETV